LKLCEVVSYCHLIKLILVGSFGWRYMNKWNSMVNINDTGTYSKDTFWKMFRIKRIILTYSSLTLRGFQIKIYHYIVWK